MKKFTYLILLAIMVISMYGCEFAATIVTDGEYGVRIVNKTGETVKIRWDDGSYRYVENECTLIISSDGGYHEMTWEWKSSSRHSRQETYKLKIDADFQIVIDDDNDDGIIIIYD
jgi:hypothetical protein